MITLSQIVLMSTAEVGALFKTRNTDHTQDLKQLQYELKIQLRILNAKLDLLFHKDDIKSQLRFNQTRKIFSQFNELLKIVLLEIAAFEKNECKAFPEEQNTYLINFKKNIESLPIKKIVSNIFKTVKTKETYLRLRIELYASQNQTGYSVREKEILSNKLKQTNRHYRYLLSQLRIIENRLLDDRVEQLATLPAQMRSEAEQLQQQLTLPLEQKELEKMECAYQAKFCDYVEQRRELSDKKAYFEYLFEQDIIDEDLRARHSLCSGELTQIIQAITLVKISLIDIHLKLMASVIYKTQLAQINTEEINRKTAPVPSPTTVAIEDPGLPELMTNLMVTKTSKQANMYQNNIGQTFFPPIQTGPSSPVRPNDNTFS